MLSPSFLLRRLSIAAVAVEFAFGCLMLQSICRHRIPSTSSSCKVIWSSCCCCFVAGIRDVVSLWRSGALSVYYPSLTTVAVDFAPDCLILYQVVRLFNSVVVVALLRHSETLSVCHLPLAAVVVEFALGCLVLLSNCRSCIQFTLLSCRIIRFFCRHCFHIAAFWRFIYVNVS